MKLIGKETETRLWEWMLKQVAEMRSYLQWGSMTGPGGREGGKRQDMMVLRVAAKQLGGIEATAKTIGFIFGGKIMHEADAIFQEAQREYDKLARKLDPDYARD